MRRFLQRLLHLLRVRRPNQDLAREIKRAPGAASGRPTKHAGCRRRARGVPHGWRLAAPTDQGTASRRPIFSLDRGRLPGCGARLSPAASKSGVHRDRGAVAGVGIGANTAIFTVANGLLFRPPAGIAEPPNWSSSVRSR